MLKSALRRLLPDLMLVPGIGCALVGAYLLGGIGLLLLVIGVGLVGLSVWMS